MTKNSYFPFRCDIFIVFYRLNTKYITSSQNTIKFIALCCTICYTTTCFAPFLRLSSCIYLALRVMYPDDKYTTLLMSSQSSYNFSLIMAGVQADQYEWVQVQGVGWQGWNNNVHNNIVQHSTIDFVVFSLLVIYFVFSLQNTTRMSHLKSKSLVTFLQLVWFTQGRYSPTNSGKLQSVQ